VYPPEHAPAGVNVAELAEDLAIAGHAVTIVTGWPSHPGGLIYDGWKARFRDVVQVRDGLRLMRCRHALGRRDTSLRKLWYYLTFALSSFVNGLSTGPADVVVCLSTPFFGTHTALTLARTKRAKFLYWIHDVHPEASSHAGFLRQGSLVYRVLLALDTFVCRRSTLVGTLTGTMRDTLLKRGLDPVGVVLLPHWVDAQKIAPAARDNPWRRRHGIALDTFVVLHAGTIGHISGAEVIVEAARILRGRRDVHFLFVGDGPLRPTLEASAQRHGLENITFLPFQPADVLSDVQATGDVGLVTLLPKSGESSIPSKMHGYTAAARPVIACVAEDSPTAELVREGAFGVVCPSSDPDALAAAISRLADNRVEARELGERARGHFLRFFARAVGTRRAAEVLAGMVSSVERHPVQQPGMPIS
jgi:colanic acid biosynthesis glycosyl transferase WcaI